VKKYILKKYKMTYECVNCHSQNTNAHPVNGIFYCSNCVGNVQRCPCYDIECITSCSGFQKRHVLNLPVRTNVVKINVFLIQKGMEVKTEKFTIKSGGKPQECYCSFTPKYINIHNAIKDKIVYKIPV